MKDPREIIDHLSPTDALSILRTLADSDEGLAQRIAEVAMSRLSGVDPEEATAVLYDELDTLGSRRSGIGPVRRATATLSRARPPTR